MNSTESSTKQKDPSQEQVDGKKDILKALAICAVAVVLVRSFFFEPFKIPSSSMVPSLLIGDHIFVSKFNYGLNIPFTKVNLVDWSIPKRGDVVVFLFPKDESLHYVKRVIGLPGDKLRFEGKDLFINGKKVKQEKIVDAKIIRRVAGEGFSGELYKETLDDMVHYIQFSRRAGTQLGRITSEHEVPEDRFFVVGDNRDDSYDSRSWEAVPRENIKGQAQIVWLSLDQDQDWASLSKVRWSRCGSLIN